MMKKLQKASDNLVTRDYLDKKLDAKLSDFVTKEYLDKKLELYATKEDLKNNTNRIMKYIDFRLEPFEEMRKDFYSFKDQVIKSLDWLVGAFKKFDEEHTILTSNYAEVSSKIDSHETRIIALEKRS